ncbi:FAD-dependent pyridine nucleotide-disulfide oxidoreductase [Cupriavidus gilardii CR3]|uniref:NAD(P)/FAD-dependent oxidoreductase n=1 Tax=Cupriavidus gilardii TaxID=82541 RepID=A0A849BAH4_9BURK|nr:NAD(P)/FAD-dependent oxidoreductase [Cupriavidus gilardii]ALD93498.1 FAD-dependent pyridine nucleotide-disulfide oxidoreductase [Cupriavidus gilardii CR3]KAB0595536.1 NAD(P)/FAD-dependent oxidoreductase [Cupriavidus gilardii]MCT9013412.1 NAD(P)/FAD-dependent oxidoreductase [Cupriavidus gilardii]MCT9016505.1 NAD(P)/FAD-dependent oxidoreductase [Cupriavidus gilardii]MCT9056275.1 NAD(P)/FAD-dependent oxidoreductase [Cupriavidus gilardii]
MRYDAIVIGGSFAGLSAATYIARARRSVCIIDAGAPRNRFATHSHGFLAHDGSNPGAVLATARQQVAAYPTTTFMEGKAVRASGEVGAFSVKLESGEVVEGARLVLAYGIADELPDLPGLNERWGQSVIHCPYCHGFEFSDQRLGVLSMSPMSVHQAMLVAEWGPTTLYLNGDPRPDDGVLAELEKRGVAIEPKKVKALHGEGAQLSAIEFADGATAPIDALFVGPRNYLNSDIAHQLGCVIEQTPFGSIIRTDELKTTTVDGVYAAGDITRGAHSVTWACSDGVMAGVAVHRSLTFGAE